jgi:hypothetical protein
VTCGWHHTISVSVSDSNKLFTSGWSKYSQLGHGDFQDHLIPHQVKALEKTKVQYVSTFPDVLPHVSPESQNVQGFFVQRILNHRVFFYSHYFFLLYYFGSVHSWLRNIYLNSESIHAL